VAGTTAYVYWFGASRGTTRGFIQVAAEGDEYHVSKRLWAVAAYSRFIRPGAVRVPAVAADPAVKLTAFRNADGSKVIELLNTGTGATTADLALDRRSRGCHGTVYLTDETHSVTEIGKVTARGSRLAVDLPARSLVTVVLPG